MVTKSAARRRGYTKMTYVLAYYCVLVCEYKSESAQALLTTIMKYARLCDFSAETVKTWVDKIISYNPPKESLPLAELDRLSHTYDFYAWLSIHLINALRNAIEMHNEYVRVNEDYMADVAVKLRSVCDTLEILTKRGK